MQINMESMISEINKYNDPINIMEVCGTHTMSICKNGIREIINENINLISGPGCPVCVTYDRDVDYMYNLALEQDVIIATYGDMIRVPGSEPERSLAGAKSLGGDIRIVYSAIDAVKIAKENSDKTVIFIGIGFETTMPATVSAIIDAKESMLKNFKVFSVHKKVEPAMRMILERTDMDIKGFLIPGHVATIIGQDGFEFLKEYNANGAITGFKGEEILFGIYELIDNIQKEQIGVVNSYSSVVRKQGNQCAVQAYEKIFKCVDVPWRGLGVIRKSGMKIKEEFKEFDIERDELGKRNIVQQDNSNEMGLCMCGDILLGKIKPKECSMFGKRCNPYNPIGPCMVSSEGSCAAYFKYQYR